jgi:cell wall-associated NlpC family hydrolase
MFFLLMVLQVSCSAHNPETSEQNFSPEKQQNQRIDKTFSNLSESRKIIVQNAIDNLGRPYKWGGDSPLKGFDCSGLIVYAYQEADIDIPRTARAQFLSGKPVAKKELKPGDLVFFQNPRAQKINHVGIFVGEKAFVHAPGQGRSVSYGYLTNPYFKKYYIGSRTYL